MTSRNPTEELRALFASVDAEGFVHAVDLASGAEVGLDEDAPVVSASVFKIWVLLELQRQAADGEIDLEERITVKPEDRVYGPTGLSVLSDAVEMSLRDLAVSMMNVSDNTATDVVLARVGVENVRARLDKLGLAETEIIGGCMDIFASLPEDLGMSAEEIEQHWDELTEDQLRRWRALDPMRTTRTTPRDTTTLLKLIAEDEAAPAEACAEVRRVMSLQVWPHRLRAGFSGEVQSWAKTGTLPGIRNEVGAVQYPDGRRYAVAVYVRTRTLAMLNPRADASIGRAAALCVSALQSER